MVRLLSGVDTCVRPDGDGIVPVRRESTNSAFAGANEAVHLLFENSSGTDGHYDLLLPLEDHAVLNPKQRDTVGTCTWSPIEAVDMTASNESAENSNFIDLTKQASATPMRSPSRSRSHSVTPQKRRRESASASPSALKTASKRPRPIIATMRDGTVKELPHDYVFPEDFPWPEAGGETPIPEVDSPVWAQLIDMLYLLTFIIRVNRRNAKTQLAALHMFWYCDCVWFDFYFCMLRP